MRKNEIQINTLKNRIKLHCKIKIKINENIILFSPNIFNNGGEGIGENQVQNIKLVLHSSHAQESRTRQNVEERGEKKLNGKVSSFSESPSR